MDNLFDPFPIEPWKPTTLTRAEWPPNYEAVYAWRVMTLKKLQADTKLQAASIAYYRLHRKEFAMHWIDTYDPRRDGAKWIPFVFFEKQSELWDMLDTMVATKNNALIEKARDMGATWVSVAWSVASWLFEDAIAVGWGSRKQELVDRIGDASSIFEKLRKTIERLPKVFRPARYDMAHMKMINHDNGASIIGEIGDSIGRGGRTSIYFKDESAHYEHAESIEAALGDNTNVQIDISSVNGPGNVFHRRRNAGLRWPEFKQGKTSIFVMGWQDHPAKTQAWYDMRRAKYEDEGLLHLFAQEVDRDYNAASANKVIDSKWFPACVDFHKRVGMSGMYTGKRVAGYDIADDGLDRNAFVSGKGTVTDYIDEWGNRDVGEGTRKVIVRAKEWREVIEVFYDSVGVGAAAKSEYNRLRDVDVELIRDIYFHPWNAGGAVRDPFDYLIANDDKTPMNGDFYYNVKAQAWWNLRNMMRRTWEFVNLGKIYPHSQMLSVSSEIGTVMLQKLEEELNQPVYKPHPGNLKMIIDKRPEGVPSPNIADAFVMRYYPIYEGAAEMTVGIGAYASR